MKRFFNLSAALLISLLAAVVLSCEKKNPDSPEKSFTVSINTGSLYEELGIKDDMAGQLADAGDFTIIDSILVYDQRGVLVGKSGFESRALENKELVLKDIPDGTYTLVLWQSAFRRSDGVRAWTVGEEKSLSTVQITSDGLSFGFGWAVGMASATVNTGTASSNLEMTPKAIGSILDVTIDNIPEDAGYIDISTIGGQYLKGLYLDPSRQEDRWIGDTHSGVLFRLYPEDGSKRKFFTLVHGEDMYLWIRGDKEDGFDELDLCTHRTIAAGNNYTVYFDIARAGWQPAFFGTAEEFAVWKPARDAGFLVLDPCLDWGSNLSHVEEYVQLKNYWYSEGEELYQSGDFWCKSFWVAGLLKEEYRFETQDGQKLGQVIAYCDDVTVPLDMAHELLIQKGFEYVGEISYPDDEHTYSYYVSADKVSQATINTYMFSNWAIGYEPYSEEYLGYVIFGGIS